MDYEIEFYDENNEDIDWEEAEEIGPKAGINILRNMELSAVAVTEDNVPVGALWLDYDRQDKTYTFDIAVLPHHQRKGIGSKLLDLAVDFLYNEELMFNDHMVCEVKVTSTIMEKMLRDRGFVTASKPADSRLWMRLELES